MNKVLLSLTAVACVAALAGCGTIQGIGKDITSLGGVISNSSDHYKEAIGNNPPGSKMESKTK